jgi:hypothetical protein
MNILPEHEVEMYGGSKDGAVIEVPQQAGEITFFQTGEIYERDGHTKSGTPRFTLRGVRRHTEGGAK